MQTFYDKLLIMLIFFWFSSSFSSNHLTFLKIETWKTEQGIPVYFVQRAQVPMIDIAVVFDAGSARDGTSYGLASFTASLLNEGADNKSASDVAKAFDSAGAIYSVFVNRDIALISLRSLVESKYFTPAFSMFNTVLAKPNFTQRSVARRKKQALSSLRKLELSPFDVAKNKIFSVLYQGHPYQHPVDGTLPTVSQFSQNSVINFYKSYYVRQNAKIVFVGDQTKKQAVVLANQIGSHLLDGEKPPSLPLVKATTQKKNIFIPMRVEQNVICFGSIGINRESPNYFALKVANFVLGGGTMTSILFDKVRNEGGLVYYIDSQFDPLFSRGPFTIALITRYKMSNRAIEITEKSLKDYLAQGPNEQQLQAAKRNILGAFPLLTSTNEAALMNVVNIAYYRLPLDYLSTYIEGIEAVDTKRAHQAFSKVVDLKKLNLVVVGRRS